jgi:hypothetical protein
VTFPIAVLDAALRVERRVVMPSGCGAGTDEAAGDPPKRRRVTGVASDWCEAEKKN